MTDTFYVGQKNEANLKKRDIRSLPIRAPWAAAGNRNHPRHGDRAESARETAQAGRANFGERIQRWPGWGERSHWVEDPAGLRGCRAGKACWRAGPRGIESYKLGHCRKLNDFLLDGVLNELGLVVDVELAHEIELVRLNSLDAEVKVAGDLLD